MPDESANSKDHREISVWEGMTAKELSENLGVKLAFVMKNLMERGIYVAVHQPLHLQLANDVAHDFGASSSIQAP